MEQKRKTVDRCIACGKVISLWQWFHSPIYKRWYSKDIIFECDRSDEGYHLAHSDQYNQE